MNNQIDYFVHKSAYVDQPCQIGKGTKIWHFCHIMADASIGEGCILGQNVHIAGGVVIGNNVKIQNNVSLYTGTVVEDDVFLGPSCVFTNVTNPRAEIVRHGLYEKTVVKRGATIGANATILCGIQLGRYCFIGAGAVVTKDVPDYALMVGSPAGQRGWISRHGIPLTNIDKDGITICAESGYHYKEVGPGLLKCLDLDEESPLPGAMKTGRNSYRQLKALRISRTESDKGL